LRSELQHQSKMDLRSPKKMSIGGMDLPTRQILSILYYKNLMDKWIK
jgi:hypothetical protein